jgi:hypothetical protein
MNFFSMKVSSTNVGYTDVTADVTKCTINVFNCENSQPTPGSKQLHEVSSITCSQFYLIYRLVKWFVKWWFYHELKPFPHVQFKS